MEFGGKYFKSYIFQEIHIHVNFPNVTITLITKISKKLAMHHDTFGHIRPTFNINWLKHEGI